MTRSLRVLSLEVAYVGQAVSVSKAMIAFGDLWEIPGKAFRASRVIYDTLDVPKSDYTLFTVSVLLARIMCVTLLH